MSTNAVHAFISMMGDGRHPERMEFGFNVLLGKDEPERYLSSLRDAGLLSTVPPTASDGGLSVWPAGSYLIAVARRAVGGEELARQVLDIVRDVTAEAAEVSVRDNYQIWRQCAEIVGHLPASVLDDADAPLIGVWLSSPFDTSLVAIELSKGLIPNLLSAGSQSSLALLRSVLEILTGFEVSDDGKGGRVVRSRVQPYWLGKVLEKHSKAFGEVGGLPIVQLLAMRVAELFEDRDSGPTWTRRPAIEENPQNLKRRELDDALVDALRDTASALPTEGPEAVPRAVADLLASGSEMLFRVGLHVARVRFERAEDVVGRLIEPAWFTGGGRHELYLLLRDRFSEFKPDFKERILELIRNLPREDDDRDRAAAREERYWLLAMSSSGDSAVAQRLAALNEELGPAQQDNREGLLSYFESFAGPGPSPYSPAALNALVEAGTLVETLNSFAPMDTWRGPSITGLVKALELAIVDSPDKYLRLRDDFLAAKPAYMVGFLNGFSNLWQKGRLQRQPTLDSAAWTSLLEYADKISEADLNAVDEAAEPLTPQLAWLPGLIAQWIEAGVKDDEYAFDVDLLPRAKNLLEKLIGRVDPVDDSGKESDAVFVAINSPRGKIIEALIALALRAKRTNQSEGMVEAVLTLLDKALRTGDLEAVTLLAAAIGQANYLRPGWAEERFDLLFPVGDAQRLTWGLRGLAYVHPARWLHVMLKERGVYLAALGLRAKLGEAWDSLLDRVTVAYLWGDDNLDDPFWVALVAEHDYQSLRRIVWFLWTQRDQSLTADHQQRIVDLWARLRQQVDHRLPGGAQLKGDLGQLTWALRAEDARAGELLPDVGSFVRQVYHDYDFAHELLRIAAVQPAVAMTALERMVADGPPVIDFEDAYLQLLRALFDAGLVDRVIGVTDTLRGIPAIRAFYEEIRNG